MSEVAVISWPGHRTFGTPRPSVVPPTRDQADSPLQQDL